MSTPAAASATCQLCHGDNFVIERADRIATARACSCIRPCKYCGGTGYRRTKRLEGKSNAAREYEVLAPCHCTILDARLATFNKMELPGVLAHARFENYLPKGTQQNDALTTVKDFALSYKKEKLNKGFILSGPVGSGKTHLLVATLRFLAIEHGVAGSYTEMALLYATIRRGFRDGRSGGEIIQPLSEVEVLAIDELGRGRGTPFELDTMDELIARRYNAGLTTILATNYSLTAKPEGHHHASKPPRSPIGRELVESATQESQYLGDHVGARIISRIHEMCALIEMPKDTPDGRLARGEVGRSRTYRGRS